MFNFDDVEIPVESNVSYLKPGKYLVDELRGQLVEEEGKTPYFLVTFVKKEGESERLASERFYLTPKSLGRIQYLYSTLTTKKLTGEYKTSADVGNLLSRVFDAYNKGKLNKLGFILGGEIKENGVRSKLPFNHYFVEADGLDEKEFVDGTSDWNQYVRLAKPTTNDTIVKEEKPQRPERLTVFETNNNSDLPF